LTLNDGFVQATSSRKCSAHEHTELMQEKACPSLNEIHSDVSGLIQTLREANL